MTNDLQPCLTTATALSSSLPSPDSGDDRYSRAANWGLNQLWQGDCLTLLPHLPDSSVDLIVTSPPYATQRREIYGGVAPDRYVAWFLPIAAQLKRVLKPDGSFILNLKENVVAGERSTYVLELILALRQEQGWLWTEEYCWHKRNSVPGKWPNRFRDGWERLLHFTKARQFRMYQDAVRVPIGEWATPRLSHLTALDQVRLDSSTRSGFARKRANWVGRDTVYPDNVLYLPTEVQNQGHSAAFPVALPTWFIQLFTQPGDLVLDPFVGSGTTALAARQLGRHYLGIELNEQSHQRALARLAQQATTSPLTPTSALFVTGGGAAAVATTTNGDSDNNISTADQAAPETALQQTAAPSSNDEVPSASKEKEQVAS